MQVQAGVTGLAIKRFDKGVVGRFTLLYEVKISPDTAWPENIALLVRPGPLSRIIMPDGDRALASWSSSRTRRSPLIEKSVICSTHSQLKSSTMFYTLNRLPPAR